MTVAQRDQALVRANEVRIANSRWKNETNSLPAAAAAARVAALLREPSPPQDAMRIAHAVMCVSRLGVNKSALIFRDAGIVNAQRPIRELTERQRFVVADRLMEISRRWDRSAA